jgi:hypothetical protein
VAASGGPYGVWPWKADDGDRRAEGMDCADDAIFRSLLGLGEFVSSRGESGETELGGWIPALDAKRRSQIIEAGVGLDPRRRRQPFGNTVYINVLSRSRAGGRPYFRKEFDMSRSASDKLAESKKWLEKNAQSDLNLKPAQAAVAAAEKAVAELASLRARASELANARDAALSSLDEALDRAKTEKRLKAKESKLQAKLAALSGPAK